MHGEAGAGTACAEGAEFGVPFLLPACPLCGGQQQSGYGQQAWRDGPCGSRGPENGGGDVVEFASHVGQACRVGQRCDQLERCTGDAVASGRGHEGDGRMLCSRSARRMASTACSRVGWSGLGRALPRLRALGGISSRRVVRTVEMRSAVSCPNRAANARPSGRRPGAPSVSRTPVTASTIHRRIPSSMTERSSAQRRGPLSRRTTGSARCGSPVRARAPPDSTSNHGVARLLRTPPDQWSAGASRQSSVPPSSSVSSSPGSSASADHRS